MLRPRCHILRHSVLQRQRPSRLVAYVATVTVRRRRRRRGRETSGTVRIAVAGIPGSARLGSALRMAFPRFHDKRAAYLSCGFFDCQTRQGGLRIRERERPNWKAEPTLACPPSSGRE